MIPIGNLGAFTSIAQRGASTNSNVNNNNIFLVFS
jgi:hypothetical protein